MKEVVSDLDRLREVALEQYGLVRTSQAADAGLSETSLGMPARRDPIERVARGLFRVPQVPAARFDPYMEAVLWTGFPEACLSHDSAWTLRRSVTSTSILCTPPSAPVAGSCTGRCLTAT
jgi:predicted transcriptional regulator of viral defense system